MDPNRDTERMFEYHEATKHTVDKLRRSRHTLNWADMPDPFRHYEDVPVIDLPADPPAPLTATFDVLLERVQSKPVADWLTEISRLLFYSASISASKRAGLGYRYALRVNPSSGNLHPTEFHLVTHGGLYHYRVSSHMLEQRGTGDWIARLGLRVPLAVVLTTITWREAWKYRERAYRYCLHDIGHAAEALRLTATACGYIGRLEFAFNDDRLTQELGLTDEWPMALMYITGFPQDETDTRPAKLLGGQPNELSERVIPYRLIETIHEASKLTDADLLKLTPASEEAFRRSQLKSHPPNDEAFGVVARRRRSALDFVGGERSISFGQFSSLIDAAVTTQDIVSLYLFAHRVRDLEPGVYKYYNGTLQCLRVGDQRVIAAGLSLSQQLAGNSCVTFSMIANLQEAARRYGNRGYRLALIEAGRIGQRLYIGSEALGFNSTGIGAFYDDEVHAYLGIAPEEGQVVYHFACGYAVPDDRIEDSL